MELPQFDPSSMKTNSTVLIVGARKSGKTVLIRDLVYNLRDKIQFGVQMGSPGEHKYLPECCSFEDMDMKIVDGIMKQQQKDKTQNVLCVLDGCANEFSDPAVREMLMNGRHRNIFNINSTRYIDNKHVPPGLRGCMDYVFVTRSFLRELTENIWKYFSTEFHDIETFGKVLEEYTKGNRVLVLDNSRRATSISWYEPQLHDSFRAFENNVLWALDKKTI
jgi:GTPase SAR1 family protein